MVEMFVYRVGMDEHGQAFVVLMDLAKERMLPILIGPYEAHAIAMELQGEKFQRPLTHDLFISVLSALNQQVAELAITRLDAGTFYASLSVSDGRRVVEVDARPSDGIALAMRAGAPILVDESVLAETEYRTIADDEQDEAERFRELMRRVQLRDETDDEG
jgi:uncharacterized protein